MQLGQHLRRASGAVAALLVFGAPPAPAQTSAPAPDAAAPGAVVPAGAPGFEAFLERHPNLEARLRENPGLVNDPAFRRNHPLFAEFLDRHPGLAAELATRPRWLVRRELIRQSAGPVSREQLAEFDRFLDQHPGLAQELTRHPHLLHDPGFKSGHPELAEFLRQHPGLDRAAEARPGSLLRRERQVERAEKAKGNGAAKP